MSFQTCIIDEKEGKMSEAKLQRDLITVFRRSFSKYAYCFFAIENKRKTERGYLLKAQGIISGVADLCLALPTEKHGALYIELKYGKNKQTENQINWQNEITKHGNKYAVCYNLNEAIDIIIEHIKEHEQWTRK